MELVINRMSKRAILFVCLGNICRSPAAEGVFKSLIKGSALDQLLVVDSAGTYGGHAGELPDSRMRRAAAKRGYDLVSQSRQVVSSDFDMFDLIVAMDDSNYHNLIELAPSLESRDKVHKFAEYITHHDIDHVPDPYYEGAEGFEYVLDLLEDGCRNMILAEDSSI